MQSEANPLPAPPESATLVRGPAWLAWLLGAALSAAVIVAALRYSEGREFIRLVEQSQPAWLLLALALQALTYSAQGEIWRRVGRAAAVPLGRLFAYELSLTKLFLDQALPSAGVSGTIFVAKALEKYGMPTAAVMSGVVVNTVSFYAAYVACLAVALAIAFFNHQANAVILITSVVFVTFGLALSIGVLRLSNGNEHRLARIALGPLRHLLGFLAQADAQLVRRPRILSAASTLQAVIFLLDAATMWALIRALGHSPPASGVFASFMISSLFRTIGILPGGLGSFEAASVLTLKLTGIGIPAALSATFLFRGLTFWLPMLPGLWLARRTTRHSAEREPRAAVEAYWAADVQTLFDRLDTSVRGLSARDATERLRHYGRNELERGHALSRLDVVVRQLRNPLLLLLVFAAVIAFVTGEWANALIVVVILVASVGITVRREYSAQTAAAALRAKVRTRSRVLRDGAPTTVPLEEIVPGDVVLLSAGSIVPADGVILEAADFYLSESVLTGESFPVPKSPGVVPVAARLSERSNCVFLGTNVRSGSARCLIVATGAQTAFGGIAERLTLRPPDTDFDLAIRRFGYLLTSTMLVIVLLVFVAHILRDRPPVDTLLFAVALAVGLSPELLPAILSVNLSRGAELMARRGVLVRRLNAIENLGSMDVLCTDKTGTLTEGVVQVEGAYDAAGAASTRVLELAAVNAALETGLANPLDDSIQARCMPDLSRLEKLGEIPFDFVRKRVSVIVRAPEGVLLITKGAFRPVLAACTRLADGTPLDPARRRALERLNDSWSHEGIRVLAVAVRDVAGRSSFDREDERELAFAGFLTFLDRPKEGVAEAVADLGRLGVTLKLITGDTRLVAEHVARLVGLRTERVLTGAQLDLLHDEALWREAERTDLFVEVDPNQKERIILSLKKMGHVVGFLGDGVNDAPAMHAADTSLSVDQAVDVARAAADFVLLERSLEAIRRGIEEGRRTFANTLKYILTTTSANLGNMISMALVSLFLPFLPLTAGQILLNNFLSDVPAVGLADDSVDPEMVERPRRWDMRFIGRFMVEFGMLSSVFDLVTFAVLLGTFHAGVAIFQTGWFTESLLTELAIALVVRTRRVCFRSRPSNTLLVSTLFLIGLALTLPYLPFTDLIGFVPLPPAMLLVLVAITAAYVASAEAMKAWFYRKAR